MIDSILHYGWRYYVRHPWQIIEDIYVWLKSFYQRGMRGYADYDIWNMDTYLAEILAPMFRKLEKEHYGYPGESRGIPDEEWTEILGIIAKGFEEYLSLDDLQLMDTFNKEKAQLDFEHKMSRVNISLQLLSRYYTELWD